MFLRRIKEISLDPDYHDLESVFWFHVFLFGWEKRGGGFLGL